MTAETATSSGPAGSDAAGLRALRFAGYEQVRSEIVGLVPESACRVLDIGCASGALGATLKSRQGAAVVGLEFDADYAAAAAGRLDDVVHGDAQEILMDRGSPARLGRFDCVVAADVLEHLRDPHATLAAAVDLLDLGGTVVVSLPNVRWWHTFWQVGVRRRWPRRDVGHFDRTHLQWFTRWDAERLLQQAGLEVVSARGVYKVSYVATKLDTLVRPLIKVAPFRDFFAAQYLLVGVRRGATDRVRA